MSNDEKCERCGKDNFRWDGRHLICKGCGNVFIRELKEKKKKPVSDRFDYSLIGHYKKMKTFKGFINEEIEERYNMLDAIRYTALL